MTDDLISLNLGENLFRVAQAKNESGKINIEVLSSQTNTPTFYESETKKVTEDTIASLRKTIDLLKLNKKRVSIVIPDGFTYSQIVYMPKLKEKELLSAIRYQADQFIPMPIDETSIDIEIIHEDKHSDKSLVLIIAAPQKLIERIENLTEQVGMYPESIENELSATARFLENFYSPQTQIGGTLFLNLGYSYSSFYYYDHKLKLLLDSHSFPAGLAVFLREAQADVNIDLAKAKELLKKTGFTASTSAIDLNQILQPAVDAMCNELQKFIASLKSKHQIQTISKIYAFNLISEIHLLEKRIEKNVSIPTAIFDPVSITKRTPAIETYSRDLSAFVATIGGCLG